MDRLTMFDLTENICNTNKSDANVGKAVIETTTTIADARHSTWYNWQLMQIKQRDKCLIPIVWLHKSPFFFEFLLYNCLYFFECVFSQRCWSVNFIRNLAWWDINAVIFRCRRASALYSSICFMEKFLVIRSLCAV